MAKRIGELLLEADVITPEQLQNALKAQRESDGTRKLGHLLIDLKLVTETQLTQTLSRQLAVPWVSLYHIEFSRSLLSFVPREVAERYSLVPIFVRKGRKQAETLYVAMDDPTNEAALRDVEQSAGIPVRPMIACPSDIKNAIRVYYGGEEAVEPPVAAGPTTQEAIAKNATTAVVEKAPPPEKPPPPPRPPMASVPGEQTALVAAPAAVDEDAPEAAAAEPTPDSEETELISGGEDRPGSSPEIEATELSFTRKRRRMLALTLLDGTTISLPAPKRGAGVEAERGRAGAEDLTARDLVSALRAVAHGVDASEILGEQPRWEAMFSALLSLLLKKGLIADWEYVEEYRKI